MKIEQINDMNKEQQQIQNIENMLEKQKMNCSTYTHEEIKTSNFIDEGIYYKSFKFFSLPQKGYVLTKKLEDIIEFITITKKQ